jgi:hypothetical protein
VSDTINMQSPKTEGREIKADASIAEIIEITKQNLTAAQEFIGVSKSNLSVLAAEAVSQNPTMKACEEPGGFIMGVA